MARTGRGAWLYVTAILFSEVGVCFIMYGLLSEIAQCGRKRVAVLSPVIANAPGGPSISPIDAQSDAGKSAT